MANAASYVLEVVGLVLLVIGYRRSNRNLLLAASLCLWFGGSLSDFVHGFMDGAREGGPF